MFITGITATFGVILLIVAALVFFSQPKEVPQEMVFNKPKVTIDFSVLNLEEFTRLVLFREMENRYTYIATVNDQEITGFVTGVTIEEARKKLEDLGYTVRELRESEIGRPNPFEPYWLGSVDSQGIFVQGQEGSGGEQSPLQGLTQEQYEQYMEYLRSTGQQP